MKPRLTKTAIRKLRKNCKSGELIKVNNFIRSAKKKYRDPLIFMGNLFIDRGSYMRQTIKFELHSRTSGLIKVYTSEKSANAAKSAYSRKYGGSHNLFVRVA